MRYWQNCEEINNARSIIRDKNGDIISTYVEPYCDEDSSLVKLMEKSFNNFEYDLKKKIDEARRILSLHTNNE